MNFPKWLTTFLVSGWSRKTAQVSIVERRRFLKAECLDCGRMVAHTRHGKAWRHDCRPPVQPEEEPADAGPHDTWDEHRGLR